MAHTSAQVHAAPLRRVGSDWPFWVAACTLGGFYLLLIVAMVLAETFYTSFPVLFGLLREENIRFSIALTLVTSVITTVLCLWVATPLGYILARWDETAWRGWLAGRSSVLRSLLVGGRLVVEAIIDVPIVLPPLVVGICLLVLMRYLPGEGLKRAIVYEAPAVVIAQFVVSCAFATRTMRVTFDQINPRAEQVALTLGCTRGQAFFRVTLPQAWRGMIAAAALAWARAVGEFGPILVFAGATRLRTEVLSTSVFLYLSTGELAQAVALSLLLVVTSMFVLVLMRVWDVSGARK